jgi:hypothetical protein
MIKIAPFKMEKGGLGTRENSCTLSFDMAVLEAVLSSQITRQQVILVRVYVNCH